MEPFSCPGQMHVPISTPFDLTGEFGGILFTNEGKRRLLLRLPDGQEQLLKVPRPLRRRMIGNFRAGQTIRVAGTQERDFATGKSKWVVSEVLPVDAPRMDGAKDGASAPVFPSGPIRVCAKKNCWRQGGRELFTFLEEGLEERGLSGVVRVKAVGCLDRCNGAPNVDWGHHEWTRCLPDDAEGILNLAASAEAAPRERPAAD